MKVGELKVGMMVEPVGDSEIFLTVPGRYETMPYVTVRNATLILQASRPRSKVAIYLGTRKDLNVDRSAMSWSDRYILLDGAMYAVDPSAWRRMQPCRQEL